MDEGGSHPCLKLGSGPEHRLLAWAGRRTGRKGLVSIPKDEARQHLEDAGYIERDESSERFRVVVRCSCRGGNPPTPEVALRREYSLRLDELSHPPCLDGGSDVASGEMEGSAQKSLSTLYLAKMLFPALVRKAGIPMSGSYGPALAHHMNRWQAQGLDLKTIELMVREFARHPEWCRRSKVPPWRVFIAKQDELRSRVEYQRRKDPANRRWSGGRDYWFGLTPAVNSPA